MGRGGRHAGCHSSNSAADNILAADARRIAEAHFARHDVQQQQQQGQHSDGATRTSGLPYTASWWKATEAVVNDIGYTIEDRFIIPATIAAIPPLSHDEDEDHASLSALIGYFMSISTLLAFAAYSRRLSNLMGGASPVMSEILFCVSHLSQVTQEQLGWSLFCSGFLTPVGCDGAAAEGSGMNGGGGGAGSGGGGSGGGSGGSGANAAGGSAARRQMLNGGSGGSSGGSGGSGIGYASYSGGKVVRYLLGRRASNVLRQESLRSYLYSSFYSPAAFLVEQVCWFVLLVSFLDTVTLQRVAVASFFGNAVGWVPVYSVGALSTLASAVLFAFMYWIPSYEIDEAVLSVLFLQSSLHHVMSAYCASLCVTLLFAESMLLDDLRRTFVATVFSLPHRVLRLTGGHPVVARLLRGCGELRRNYLYFVDFYFFLGMMFWVSLVLMEAAAGISILGIATLLMTVPWVIGSGWGTAPMRALKDTLVYVSFYGVTAVALAHVVPSNALPFLSNAVQAAAILLFMVARCEHKQPGGCVHVLLWVGMLALYLYETVGTGRGAAWSMMWLPHESVARIDYANAANVALRDHADPNAEAIGLLRMICVTFWQLLSKGLSDAGTQVVHFNVVVLGSMILMATTVRAVVVEGVGLSTANPTTVAGVATPTPAASTHAAPVAAAKNRASSGAANSAAAAAAVATAAGAAATGALRGTANGVKALGRVSRTDSTRGSGANLDASEVGSPDGADPGVLPITSEDDAVEESREKDRSTTPSPVEDEDEKAMTAEEGTSTPTTGEVVGYPPTNVLQETETPCAAPAEEGGEAVKGERGDGTSPQEVEASSEPEVSAVSATVEAAKTENDVEEAQAVGDTPDSVVGKDTEQTEEEAVREEASAPAIEDTAVESSDHDAVVKEEEEASNSDTTTPTTDAESGAAEKVSPRDLADANNVVESASQTSRSEAGSLVPTAVESGGKAGASNASRTSHSSVSADDPTKKTRREKERERKKLQQERRRASAQAEAEEKRKLAAAAADAAAVAAAAAKTAAAPVLPVPRSQTECVKNAAALANGEAGAAAASKKASSLPAAEKKTPAVEAKAAPLPPVMKETAPVPPRAGEAGKQDKTEPVKGSNSNSNNKTKVSPTSPSPVSSKESGIGGSAVGSKTTPSAVSPPSTTAAAAPAPFPLPKPRHEQVAAGKGTTTTAAAAPGSVSPAAKTAVAPAAVAAATATVVVTASPPTTGATSPSPQLTAAEKLRRSANGTAGAKDGKAVPSSTSTPASKNPATTKAATSSLAAAAAPAKPPVVAPSSPQQRQQNAPANVPGAESAAAPAVSPPPSLPLPLPRSAQSAEAAEAKKEVAAATAATAATAAVAPVVASTPAAAASTPTARPVHTKTDIRAVESCEPLQRAWREMEPITHVPDATLEPSVSDHGTEQESAECAAKPARAAVEVNAAVAVTASAPPQTEASIAREDVDESYDLDRVLNFLKLKQVYVEENDESSRSSSAASSRGGYRGNAFFQPETPTVSQTTRARFTTGSTQATPEPSNNNAIGLFSTVPQPSDHGGSLHDLSATALRISCSAASLHDTPHRTSRSPQPAPEWLNRTSGSTYGDVVSDSFASGNFCPSGGSFHVFSTHPQGAAAVAAQAAAQAQRSHPSPRPQLTSPNPQLSHGGGLSSVPGTSLLRPVGTAERDDTPFAMRTPPLYSKADSPPTGYFGVPSQTPPSPMSEAQTMVAPLPHMPFSVSTVGSGAAGLPPSFAEVMHVSNSSGSAGSGKANTATGSNSSKSSMTYVTVGGAAVGGDRQQSVFARLRAVPNARGAMGEPMVMSPTPPSGGMQAMQASAVPGMTQQPMMVMMTTPEGQMALYPVMYNQPMYVMDANGMMHQTQAAAQQQVVYTTPAAAAAQAQMRGQLDGVTYQMAPQGVFLPPSSSQASSSPGLPPYATQPQQPY